MTVTLKEFAGGAQATTLSSGITNSATTLIVADGSSFPTGSTAPFVIVIARGTASEEKILVTSRSGNTLTLTTRGYDGSAAAAHSAADAVEHCLDATTITEANKAAVNTIGKITTLGDLLVGTGSEAAKRLAIGTARQNVQVNSAGTDLAYAASLASLLTTKGDLPGASAANTPGRLGVSGVDGRVLTEDAASTLGFKWSAPTSGAPANGTATVATSEATSSTSFTDLTTPGPAVSVVTGTKALVTITAHMQHDTINAFSRMAFAVSGATTVAAAQAKCLEVRAGDVASEVQAQHSATYLITGLTAGSNTFTAKYFSSTAGGNATFENRNIIVVDMGS